MTWLRLMVTMAVVGLGAHTSAGADSVSREETLRNLAAKIAEYGRGSGEVDSWPYVLKNQLVPYGGEAIPFVLPLLKHDEARVRKYAAYIAGRLSGYSVEHLAALLEAYRNGERAVSPAIGQIDSPAVVPFLIGEFVKRPEMNSDLSRALVAAGGRSSLALVGVLAAPGAADDHQLVDASCEIFQQIRAAALPAVQPLMDIAAGHENPEALRQVAIRVLGELGQTAQSAIAVLDRIATEEAEDFRRSVWVAVRRIRTPRAIPVLERMLKTDPSLDKLSDLADLLPDALSAGATIAVFLDNRDWDLRVGAARALGFLGYREGGPALIHALENNDDWRLVYVAAGSLGRLREGAAVEPLRRVAATHWYAPVRAAARKAMAAIAGQITYGRETPDGRILQERFLDYMYPPRDEKASTSSAPLPPLLVKGPDQLGAEELKALRYRDVVRLRGEPPEVHWLTPWVGLRVPGGLILGGDRGGWGGEVVFFNGGDTPRYLIMENVAATLKWSAGLMAITRGKFFHHNEGILYRIEPAADGSYCAAKWKMLPGYPTHVGFLPDGRLFVRSFTGDDVAVRENGEIEMWVAQLTTLEND